ncbi:MAG TPA: acetoacetate--CoA ligase [Acidimicrobiales bacterium]|nr:acetoacetate--CoA ligase [Acidimicrobiales bacterium]
MSTILWAPSGQPSRIESYRRWLGRGGTYEDLWRWSVTDLDGFWASIWDYFGVDGRRRGPMLADAAMPGARWCPDATVNYAAHALRWADADRVAVIAHSQTRGPITLTMAELRAQVGRAREGLCRLGIGPGDRVAAYLPNIPETLVAFLATASLGAVWSSCAPEFGTRSVIDRFSQIAPTVLLAVDGYRYGAASYSRREEVAAIRAALPSLRATVVVPYLGSPLDPAGAVSWESFMASPGALAFEAVPFDHPLYVLYSSGTTGLPKPIVHGHGGILLEHLKALALHADLGEEDRFFWFSTTGWMMWNLLVSGLLVGSAVVLFDGNPAYPDLSALWDLASATGVTYFGTSAGFLMSCRKEGLVPSRRCSLEALRGVGSTGSPLPASGFEWVYSSVSPSVLLASVSGGTDVCTAFVGGCPLVPVYAGEISCRYLGAAVAAFGPDGTPCPPGVQGELVVTAPMPSMPVGFWGDPGGDRYREAYFSTFPGVWRHGDWITFTSRGTCIISGRSDATLNRGGVRVGTAEYYSVVESLPSVADSLVVHLEDAGGGAGSLLLFVVPSFSPGPSSGSSPSPGSGQGGPGTGPAGSGGSGPSWGSRPPSGGSGPGRLDDAIRDEIVAAIRTSLSPRHVPDEVYAVPAIPRTLSGKKLEVPVKRILTGTPADEAASRGALADPTALAAFEELGRRR